METNHEIIDRLTNALQSALLLAAEGTRGEATGAGAEEAVTASALIHSTLEGSVKRVRARASVVSGQAHLRSAKSCRSLFISAGVL